MSQPDVSIIIPALNESGNIGELVSRVNQALSKLGIEGEVIVVDGGSTDTTVSEATDAGASVEVQELPGYGGALRKGFASARAPVFITMDSDLSHEPEVIGQLWEARESSNVIIASRYVPGGNADMSIFRAILSRILNFLFTRALAIPVRDISSGYRLYQRAAIDAIDFHATDFDVLEEILIRIYNDGGTVSEIPFHYRPRKEGKSHAKLFKFGVAYLKTLHAMWRLRRKK